MFEKLPEYSKIVPIFAIVFLRKDGAIAQTTHQPQPLPQTQNAIDPVAAGGYFLAVIISIAAIAPKLIEKWFGGELEARQNKNKLQVLVTKNKADLELEDKQKQLEAAQNLSDFYLQTAKESQKAERDLLMLFVTKELDASAQMRDQLYDLIANQAKIISRLDIIEENQRKNAVIYRDIMNVLKMRERGDNGTTNKNV
jgi:hypothetical protein